VLFTGELLKSQNRSKNPFCVFKRAHPWKNGLSRHILCQNQYTCLGYR